MSRGVKLAVFLAALFAPGFLWAERMATAPAPAHAATRPEPALTTAPTELPPPLPPMPEDEIRCRVPRVAIAHTNGCDAGRPYPSCRWQMPEPRAVGHTFTIWRNTTADSRSARPALVSLALAVADEYARQFPGETLAIGDLDAPGPRHNSHDDGVDIDLYLPGAMEVENLGSHEFVENYAELTPLQRRMHRARVLTLAKILATCADGRVRIYYNDDDVQARFERWYDAQGWHSEFGRAMQGHNDLHRFHFHVRIPPDLAPVPMAPEGEEG